MGSRAGDENDIKESNTVLPLCETTALSVVEMHIFPGPGRLISCSKHFEIYLRLLGRC